jgi:hypothetical protein
MPAQNNDHTLPLDDFRLHAIEGEEHLIPKYGLEQDFRYFDLDSLIRMYGRQEVESFLKRYGMRLIAPEQKPDDSQQH